MINTSSTDINNLHIELQYLIYSYLNQPRLMVNKDVVKYQTDMLFFDSSEKSRKWQKRFLELLSKGPVFYNPLDNKKIKFNDFLRGRKISAKYRLNLMRYFLKQDSYNVSSEESSFIRFCLDKPTLHTEVLLLLMQFAKKDPVFKEKLLEEIQALSLGKSISTRVKLISTISAVLQTKDSSINSEDFLNMLRPIVMNQECYAKKFARLAFNRAISLLGSTTLLKMMSEFKVNQKDIPLPIQLEFMIGLCKARQNFDSSTLLEIHKTLKDFSVHPDKNVRCDLSGYITQSVDLRNSAFLKPIFNILQKLSCDSDMDVKEKGISQLCYIVKYLDSSDLELASNMILTFCEEKLLTLLQGRGNQGELIASLCVSLSGLDSIAGTKILKHLIGNQNLKTNLPIWRSIADKLSRVYGQLDSSLREAVFNFFIEQSSDFNTRNIALSAYEKILKHLTASEYSIVLKKLNSWATDAHSEFRCDVVAVLGEAIRVRAQSEGLKAFSILKSFKHDASNDVKNQVMKQLMSILGSLSFSNRGESYGIAKELFSSLNNFNKIAAINMVSQVIMNMDDSFRFPISTFLLSLMKGEDESIQAKIIIELGILSEYWTMGMLLKVYEHIVNYLKKEDSQYKSSVVRGLGEVIKHLKPSKRKEAFMHLKVLSNDPDKHVSKEAAYMFSVSLKYMDAETCFTALYFLNKLYKKSEKEVKHGIVSGLCEAIYYQDVSVRFEICKLLKIFLVESEPDLKYHSVKGLVHMIEHLDEQDIQAMAHSLEVRADDEIRVVGHIYSDREKCIGLVCDRVSELWPNDEFRNRLMNISEKTLFFKGIKNEEESEESTLQLVNIKRFGKGFLKNS